MSESNGAVKTPMFEIENLHVEIEGKEILKGVNLTVNEGEIHALMGPNGSGKSTLAYVIAGPPRYEVTEGSIRYRRRGHPRVEPDERARKGLFLAFQYPTSSPACRWRTSCAWPSPTSAMPAPTRQRTRAAALSGSPRASSGA